MIDDEIIFTNTEFKIQLIVRMNKC